MQDVHDCPGPPRRQWPGQPPELDWSELDEKPAAGVMASGPTGDQHAHRDAEGIKNLRDHMACIVAIWDDRQRPKGERHYQDGAMDLQVGYSREWLKSIEGEWVNERIAKLAYGVQGTSGGQNNG